MSDIDPTSEKQRRAFLEWMQTGDPVRDRWSEMDLAISLERAYYYIDGMIEGLDRVSTEHAPLEK